MDRPQLYQPRQTMLGSLPPLAVFGKALTLLKGQRLLQEHFLGTKGYRASRAVSSRHALGPQWAEATELRVELNTLGQPVP